MIEGRTSLQDVMLIVDTCAGRVRGPRDTSAGQDQPTDWPTDRPAYPSSLPVRKVSFEWSTAASPPSFLHRQQA